MDDSACSYIQISATSISHKPLIFPFCFMTIHPDSKPHQAEIVVMPVIPTDEIIIFNLRLTI